MLAARERLAPSTGEPSVTTEFSPAAAVPARSGWRLTLRIGAVLCLGSLAMFAAAGVSEESVRAWVRATARASLALFLMTFVARPLRHFWRGEATRWLLANRRYLGASAAFAQLLHGLSLVWLFDVFAGAADAPDRTTLIGGGLGFAFYFAMGLSSNDAAVALLGRRGWKLLHTVGAYWVWFIFAITNWGNVQLALSGELSVGRRVLYVALQTAIFGALALRAAARLPVWRTG